MSKEQQKNLDKYEDVISSIMDRIQTLDEYIEKCGYYRKILPDIVGLDFDHAIASCKNFQKYLMNFKWDYVDASLKIDESKMVRELLEVDSVFEEVDYGLSLFAKFLETLSKFDIKSEISIECEDSEDDSCYEEEDSIEENNSLDLTDEERKFFAREWNKTRFSILRGYAYYIDLNKAHSPEPIELPSWFKRSPYSSEIERSSISKEKKNERDCFINEWDVARLKLITNIRDIKSNSRDIPIGNYKPENIYTISHFRASWTTNEPTQGWPEVRYSTVPGEIIEEAANYVEKNKKTNLESLGGDYYRRFSKIMDDIFCLEGLVCELGLGYNTLFQIDSLLEEIIYWLDNNIGPNKFVGKFKVTEYAYHIQEKFEELKYCDKINASELGTLVHNLDHLAFRVCTYFGYYFKNVRNTIGIEAQLLYDKLQRYKGKLDNNFDFDLNDNLPDEEDETLFDDTDEEVQLLTEIDLLEITRELKYNTEIVYKRFDNCNLRISKFDYNFSTDINSENVLLIELTTLFGDCVDAIISVEINIYNHFGNCIFSKYKGYRFNSFRGTYTLGFKLDNDITYFSDVEKVTITLRN